MLSVRKTLEKLTKPQLIKLGKEYNVPLSSSNTKTGMISRLMGTKTADKIRSDVEKILSKQK